MKSLLAFFIFSFPHTAALAAECSHLWNTNLEINPAGPKGYVGDTYAAYGLLGYKNVEHLAWRLEFSFPKGRFMSIETYTDTKKIQYDAQFDFEFEPLPGSENPYRDGVEMNTTSRELEVHLIPREGQSEQPNVVHISPTEPVHAVYYRAYVPSSGVTITERDLPRVFPYHYVTGEEMPCPEAERGVIFAPNLPQAVVAWVPPRRSLKFKRADETIFSKITASGNNAAIPSYLYSLSRMRDDQVALVKFKAPSFFDTMNGTGAFRSQGDVRYWSFCTQNLAKGDTLTCLPDFLAKPDSEGIVKLAIGRGQKIESYAQRHGYFFLEDRRGQDQPVLQMIYRNLLPNAEFKRESMYQGDYVPEGRVCSDRAFLSGTCRLGPEDLKESSL